MKNQNNLPNKKIISINEMKSLGYSYFKINQLIRNGVIIRLNNKYVENYTYVGSETDWVYVEAFVPNGVVCLMSAAVIYNLTNYRPDKIDVAIERSKKVSTLPSWPEINIRYFEKIRFEIGIDQIEVDGRNLKIYDIEKTVNDIIYFRNKIGIEETKEILKNYLKRKDRNLNKLIRYAEKLKTKEILNTYLEVLL